MSETRIRPRHHNVAAMTMAPRLAFVAAILTPALGTAYLMCVAYIAEQCFRTTFLGGGCSNLRTNLAGMLGVAPLQLLAPITFMLVVSALAVVAWISSPTDRRQRGVAACSAGYVLLTAPLTLVIGPIFVAPLLLLVACTLLGAGADPREIVRVLAKGTVIVLGAFAATLAAIALWGVGFGAVPLGPQPIWLYVGLATALGIAAGCMAAAWRRRSGELLRALVLAYAGFGAGAFAATLAVLPVIYPNGRVVGLGLGGAWLTAWTLLATNLIAGVAVWRIGGRLPWRGALGATVVSAVAFLLAATATVAVATRIVAGELTPPIPLLPSTSTSE